MRCHDHQWGVANALCLGTAAVVVIALTSIAVLSASNGTSEGADFSEDVVFDNSQHALFWCGHELQSPVRFSILGSDIVANGIIKEREAVNYDSIFANRVSHVPFIARQRAKGLSYSRAMEEYYMALARNLQSIGLAYRRELNRGSVSALYDARAVADTEMILARESIRIDSVRVTVTDRVYGRFARRIDDPIPDLRKVSPPKDPTPAALRLVESLRARFTTDEPVLVLAGPDGAVTVTGRVAMETRKYLRAVARAGAIIDYMAAGVDSSVIPRGLDDEIHRVAKVAAKERAR